jgi:hypothetical protein
MFLIILCRYILNNNAGLRGLKALINNLLNFMIKDRKSIKLYFITA